MENKTLEKCYMVIENFGIPRRLIDVGSKNEISSGIAEELCEMIQETQSIKVK